MGDPQLALMSLTRSQSRQWQENLDAALVAFARKMLHPPLGLEAQYTGMILVVPDLSADSSWNAVCARVANDLKIRGSCDWLYSPGIGLWKAIKRGGDWLRLEQCSQVLVLVLGKGIGGLVLRRNTADCVPVAWLHGWGSAYVGRDGGRRDVGQFFERVWSSATLVDRTLSTMVAIAPEDDERLYLENWEGLQEEAFCPLENMGTPLDELVFLENLLNDAHHHPHKSMVAVSALDQSGHLVHLVLQRDLEEFTSELMHQFQTVVPASSSQKAAWMMESLSSETHTYHIPGGLQLHGQWSVALLERALSLLVQRHPALRTALLFENNEVVQGIRHPEDVPLIYLDAQALVPQSFEQCLESIRNIPFDLEMGRLTRFFYLQTNEHQYLFWILHHVCFDGVSSVVMLKDLVAIYRSLCTEESLAEPPRATYADFAQWQRMMLQSDEGEAYREWWKQQLSGLSPYIHFPATHEHLHKAAHGRQILQTTMDGACVAMLRKIARHHKVSLFTLLLTAFMLVLYRVSGQRDLAVVTPFSGRPSSRFEDVIGYFINLIVLRMQFDGSSTLEDLLAQAGEMVAGALDHGYFPFAELMEAMDFPAGENRLDVFQTCFVFQNWLQGKQARLYDREHSDAALTVVDLLHETGGHHLTLEIFALEKSALVYWKYDPHRFSASLIHKLSDAFSLLTKRFEEHLSQPVAVWNDFHNMFLPTMRKTPEKLVGSTKANDLWQLLQSHSEEAIALESQEETLTYVALRTRIATMAHALADMGVGHETRVAFIGHGTVENIVAMLAVYQLGGIFLPLDPKAPISRLHQILKQAQCSLILEPVPDGLPLEGLKVIEPCQQEQSSFPYLTVPPSVGAYMIFTSGSTGQPKGVVVTRENLMNFVVAAHAAYDLRSEDRVLQFSSLAFDAAIEEIWGSLTIGATLVLRNEDMLDSTVGFGEVITQHRISVLDLPTAFWHQLCEDRILQGLKHPPRAVIIGGERADPRHVRSFLETCQGITLYNSYGPTETTVVASVWQAQDNWLQQPEANEVPIGRGLMGYDLYVLDQRLCPVAIGDEGELCIGGKPLARGYWRSPALTAKAFVPNPFSDVPGSRLYKTGDLVVVHEELDTHIFAGRVDEQIKIRGFRVEPEEIEVVLCGLDGVHSSVVRGQLDQQGRPHLVAWIRMEQGAHFDEQSTRTAVAAQLPSYMVPQSFVSVSHFPLTSRGKLDITALPAPGPMGSVLLHTRPPADFEEQLLTEIWCEVLGLGTIHCDDNFFELGGHSLSATRVLSRMRKVFRKELKLKDFFQQPTINGLTWLLRGDRAKTEESKPIERGPGIGFAPLSIAQRRLWLVSQFAGAQTGYIVSWAIEMEGPLRVDYFEQAMNLLIERHGALRTQFVQMPGEDEASQEILEEARAVLSVVDLQTVRRETFKELVQDYALAGARTEMLLDRAPLLRTRLVLGNHSAILLLHVHHLICDAWSIDVMMREWSMLYEGMVHGTPASLPHLPLSYADYARWQSEQHTLTALRANRAWWREQLDNTPEVLPLPHDFPRSGVHQYEGATQTFSLPTELHQKLMALSQKIGVTLFSTLLAGYKILLARYANSRDILVGSPVANRKRLSLENLVGFFINTIVLRSTLPFGPGPCFEDFVGMVHQTALDAYAHEDVPFEMLVEDLAPDRSRAYNPLFQVTFQYLYMPASSSVADVHFRGIDLDYGLSRFDMSMHLGIRNNAVTGYLEYNTSLFRGSTIERFCNHYLHLLTNLVDAPAQGVFTCSFLSEDERQQLLVQWGSHVRDFPKDGHLAALFERSVAMSPLQNALCWGSERLSYAQLNRNANRLAHYLRKQGVVQGQMVGVCLRSCGDLVVTLLAVIKVGAAYVSMEPDYPVDRLAFMVEDAAISVVVTNTPDTFSWSETLAILSPSSADDQMPDHNPSRREHPQRAYICYTSGSTGKPKGVVVTHRNVLRLVFDTYYLEPLPGDRFAQAANPAFDALTFEVWTPLLHQLPLVFVDKHSFLQPEILSAQIEAQGITVMFMTTAVFNQCAREMPGMFASMRYVLFGGEQVDPEMVRQVLEHGPPEHLLHVYGPTESTTFSHYYPIAELTPAARNVPIGTPIANTSSFVLDALMQPVPVGVEGELYLGGQGLAEGYLGRPALTASVFVPHPFTTEKGARLYRTGDLVRHAQGNASISFQGRVDHQVKIRGFRVEPGEVEVMLKSCPGVVDGLVRAVQGKEDRYLAAWFVGEQLDAVRAFLEDHLPTYMIPSALIPMVALPLNANGKVDWRSLPDPEEYKHEEERLIVEPRSALEESILEVWQKLLPDTHISITDNLFRLGAHSLMMARAASRLWDALGLSLPIDVLFEHSSVAALAQYIEIARWSREAGDENESFEEEGVI